MHDGKVGPSTEGIESAIILLAKGEGRFLTSYACECTVDNVQ